MSQEAFKLVGIVEARTRGAENNLRRVDRVAQATARSMGTSMGSTERGFLSAGRAASGFLERFSHISQIIQGIPQIGALAGALTRPLFNAAQEGIKLNMTLEQALIGYEQVAGSREKAAKFLRELQDFGQHSPFRFEGLLQGSRLMTTFGFTLDEQIPKLRIWGNAIASSGELSADKIHDVVTAFGQMRMAGRVNGQDMMQLTNANIPGWELLARAIGKTVAETRKLSEAGRLDGGKAVEAITAMMEVDPRFKNMMARLEKTTAGRLSAAEDTLQFAQAKATTSLTSDISKTLEAALSQGNVVDSLAGSINSALTPVSGAIRASAVTLLGGGITGGITEGIAAGKAAVLSQVGSLGQGVIDTFANMLGINSPSTVFIAFGRDAADGFNIGFAEGMSDGTLQSVIDRMLGDVKGQLSGSKKRSAENLAKLMEREPRFKDKLIRGSKKRGINPDHLLNVMAVETAGSFSPAAKNPNSTASGLIQFMRRTAEALGTTTQAIRKLSATQQLDLVFRYFDDFLRRGKDLSTQGALYAAVAAGKVGQSDNSVLLTRNSRGYRENAAVWDPNRDGLIQQGEIGRVALNKLGAGVNFTVNGSSSITTSNPMPVIIVSAQLAQAMAVARGAGTKKLEVGGTASLTFGPQQIERSLAIVERMRDSQVNGAIAVTQTVARIGEIIPRTATAIEQVATDTERIVKGAGEWADVISQSEEATKRLSVQWDGVAQSFESAFINAANQAMTGDVLGALRGFFTSLALDLANQFNAALSARLSKRLFNFEGTEGSGGTGGLIDNFFNKLLKKIGLGPNQASATPPSVSGGSRPRRAGSTMPQTRARLPEAGGEASVSTGDLRQATDEITSAVHESGHIITQQAHADAEYIVSALTPQRQGFWSGLLSTVLNAAVGAAVGGAVGGLFDGGESGEGGEGPAGSRPTTAPTLQPFNPGNDTRPRTVGGRAFGGSVLANQTYLVGEQGPEKFTPGVSGFITPNNRLGPNQISNRYVTVNLTQNIQTTDPQSFQRSARQNARSARGALASALA